MKKLTDRATLFEFITLHVNGENHELMIPQTWTLLDVLRDKLGLTGTKCSCDSGVCGSCTVLVDGKPVLSCMMLAVECKNKDIVTIEGLADSTTGRLHPIQQAFVDLSGIQCGICSPGMIMTAKALLDKNLHPTEDEIREALSGNLCRCGSYQRIVECVLAAAKKMRGIK